MGPIDLALHLLGFAAPALFLALLLPLASRLVLRRPPSLSWWLQATLLFLAGLAVMAGGLWHFGRDGKMLTYAALAVVTATVQWVVMRAWKP